MNNTVFSQTEALHPVRGTLVDQNQDRLGYVTVILKSETDSTRLTGTVCDSLGQFEIKVPEDQYAVLFSLIGYDQEVTRVKVHGAEDLGTIVLKENNTQIDAVTVTAERFRWEADRVVWGVEGSPFTIGKTALELLGQAPGVWVDEFNGRISINGKTGTRVMVNDRIVRGNGAQVAAYLNNLKAEDILKIEVIPTSGADQDADMIGGLLKITLRQQRDNGLNGSVEFRYSGSFDENVYSWRPSANLNFKQNKLSLYAFLNYSHSRSLELSGENIEYYSVDRKITSDIAFVQKNDNGAVRLGGIYDFDEKNSLGFEVNYTPSRGENNTHNISEELISANLTTINSLFTGNQDSESFSASGNYIRRLKKDDSTLKIFADYTWQKSENPQDYFSAYRGYVNRDTTYRSRLDRVNRIYSVSADVDLKLTETSRLKTGGKYTYNDMDNSNFFESLIQQQWSPITSMNNDNTFHENIGALYADYSIRFRNQMSLKAGVRGEYTHAKPRSEQVEIDYEQDYFDIFPTFNLMVPLKKDFGQLLMVGYGRKIRRPSFADLNPFRIPASEFSFIVGNPYLKPSYSNDYSLTWVMAQKYSVTLGIMDRHDDFGRVAIEDPDNPGVMLLRQENIASNTNYFVNVNLPLSLTKWWKLNTNLFASHNRLEVLDEKYNINVFRGNLSSMVTFCKNYNFNIDFVYSSPTYNGNLKNYSFHQMNASVSGRFAKKRITASIFVRDILDSSQIKFRVNDENFHRRVEAHWSFREFGATLRYNFKSGKDFKTKRVESGVQDEKERL